MAYKNLAKKLIGMYLMQTSIILFYISLATKWQATVPILQEHIQHISATQYINPLPHVLMLTAIVVGVSTLGVSLALLITIYKAYGTLEEDELLKKMENSS